MMRVAVGEAEHGAHGFGGHRAGAVGDRLVEDRLRVAHRAFRRARDHGQRLILGVDAFQPSDRCEDLP